MSDWKTSQVRALTTQVESEHDPKEQQVRSLIVQVEHEGGGGTPDGQYVRSLTTQVEYKIDPRQIQLRSLVIQVECGIGYPIVPLTGYAPRILVDMYLESDNVHYSTENLYVEEL